MSDWTVFLETDAEGASARLSAAVQDELPLPGTVGYSQGVLCAVVTVPGAPRAGHAVTVAEAALQQAMERVRMGEAAVVRVEALPSGQVDSWAARIPLLATPASLAEGFGKTPRWVRELLARRGAPEPVAVEGGVQVYVKAAALAYLRQVIPGA